MPMTDSSSRFPGVRFRVIGADTCDILTRASWGLRGAGASDEDVARFIAEIEATGDDDWLATLATLKRWITVDSSIRPALTA